MKLQPELQFLKFCEKIFPLKMMIVHWITPSFAWIMLMKHERPSEKKLHKKYECLCKCKQITDEIIFIFSGTKPEIWC